MVVVRTAQRGWMLRDVRGGAWGDVVSTECDEMGGNGVCPDGGIVAGIGSHRRGAGH